MFLEEPISRYNMDAPFLEIKMTTSLKYYDTTHSKVTNLMYKLLDGDLWLALGRRMEVVMMMIVWVLSYPYISKFHRQDD